jgi:hypothetical protein
MVLQKRLNRSEPQRAKTFFKTRAATERKNAAEAELNRALVVNFLAAGMAADAAEMQVAVSGDEK